MAQKVRTNFIITGCEGAHNTCDYSPIDEDNNDEGIDGIKELMQDLIAYVRKNPDKDIFIECNYYSKPPIEGYYDEE